MQNTRKQTKTNGKKCQKATTRFFFFRSLIMAHTLLLSVSLGLDPQERSMVRELCWLWLCVLPRSPTMIHCTVSYDLQSGCVPILWFAVQCGSCLCYQRLTTVTDSPQKRGGAGLRKAVGRSKQRAKKFHLRVSLLDTFSIHQLCLSIKLITNSIKTH